MTFEEHHNSFLNQEDTRFNYETVGLKEGEEAIKDLLKADQEEVFKLIFYLEGVFLYESECGYKLISIGYSCTAGVELLEYMKIKDFFEIERGGTKIDFLSISLNKDAN